jgi:hypothetical protein
MQTETRSFALGLILCIIPCHLNAGDKAAPDNAARLLGIAEAQTSGLRGIDRAYAYWLISRVYAKAKPTEEGRLVRESCEAAIVAPADDSTTTFKEKIEFDLCATFDSDRAFGWGRTVIPSSRKCQTADSSWKCSRSSKKGRLGCCTRDAFLRDQPGRPVFL